MIASTILKLTLTNNKFFNKISDRFIRQPSIRILNDPEVQHTLFDRSLYLPLSHNLPTYQHKHKYFDTSLGRIAQFIRAKHKELVYVDVGANIGDTLASVFVQNSPDMYLAIEPSNKYLNFLHKNFGRYKNVLIEETICRNSVNERYAIEEKRGTARLIKDHANSLTVKSSTLTSVVKKYKKIGKPNLIKIDTDGFDFDVIQSGKEVIIESKPFLYFECDHFNNPSYWKDFEKVLEIFKKAEYENLLIYSNYGYLLGKYKVRDNESLKDLLNYQQISNFGYFDILAVPQNAAEFIQREREFFAEQIGK